MPAYGPEPPSDRRLLLKQQQTRSEILCWSADLAMNGGFLGEAAIGQAGYAANAKVTFRGERMDPVW